MSVSEVSDASVREPVDELDATEANNCFTRTPLIAGEELTKEVFGDYISIYNFKQSIDDGNTVPLYYENRIPELQITNDNLTSDIAKIIDEAELDDDQEQKLEREFGRE